MAKLGYTWYPKDWNNDEEVFELTLSERGLYRELIDLAMLNDNKTLVKKNVWSRKFNISIEGLEQILNKLISLKLIKITGEKLFIPSCEKRLNLIRGGRKGGKKSKPNDKPTPKPTPKPEPNQKETKIEREIEKEIESNLSEDRKSIFLEWLEYRQEIKKPIKVLKTIQGLIKKFNKYSSDKCKVVVQNSIDNNYQGLFWDKVRDNVSLSQEEKTHNEPLVVFKDNVNPTPRTLPKSEFLKLQEQGKAGGYIYTVIEEKNG